MMAPAGSSGDLRIAVGFGDTTVVSILGELDAASAPELAAVLDGLVERGHGRISLQCDELTFIDAAGLGTLVAAQRRAGSSSGVIRVRGLSEPAYRIFEITGLIELFQAQRHEEASAPEGTDAGDPDRLALLASRLAADSARADVLADTLAHIATLAPKLIAHCDGASVTLRRGERLVTAAASDETVRHLDGVQYAERAGPCVDASDVGVQIHAPALAEERRWVPFTAAARRRGMASVLSTPLTADDQPNGALNLYSRTPDAFPAADQDLASAFAALAAMLLDRPDETTADQFDAPIRDALVSRDVIARAQGVLMERHGLGAGGAFERLLHDSIRSSTPLRVRARDVVEGTQTGPIPPEPEAPSNG